MKIKLIIMFLLSLLLLIMFLAFPSTLISSTAKGMMLCYEVLVPSLFPFTVISMFIFSCGVLDKLKNIISPISFKLAGLDGNAFLIMLMSFFGGFPVGAKLINESVKNGNITRETANRMLCYCVNPGPAFIIIGIGQGIFKNIIIGYIIFISNIISSVIICTILSKKEKKHNKNVITTSKNSIELSDIFVTAVYDSCSSIIVICGYVILFSAIIGMINQVLNFVEINKIVALLEISNGIIIFSDNIYSMSFLTAFSGICVHMQIMSLCKNFKIKYLMFFIFKLLSGGISLILTSILIKLFNISVPVISLTSEYTFNLGADTVILSGSLILMSIVLLTTLKEKYVENTR